MKEIEVVGERRSVLFDPPEDNYGYFGIIMRPWWMPRAVAYLFRRFLKVELGWLNRQRSDKANGGAWFIYPTGQSFDENGKKNRPDYAKPFLWCSIKSYHRVKVTFLGGSPFNCKTEDPNGSYSVAK